MLISNKLWSTGCSNHGSAYAQLHLFKSLDSFLHLCFTIVLQIVARYSVNVVRIHAGKPNFGVIMGNTKSEKEMHPYVQLKQQKFIKRKRTSHFCILFLNPLFNSFFFMSSFASKALWIVVLELDDSPTDWEYYHCWRKVGFSILKWKTNVGIL